MKPFLALIPLLAMLGCSAGTYTFQVELHNKRPEPVTAWLTKEGGPEEPDWYSPERVASAGQIRPEFINGVVVPPGKTASLGPIKGKFDRSSFAVLRVYAGQLTLQQLLATPADGPLRADVPLDEGLNRLVVGERPPFAVTRE